MRQKIMVLLTVLALSLVPAFASGQTACVPSPADYWVCDPAPGYFLPKEIGDEVLRHAELGLMLQPILAVLKEIRIDLEGTQAVLRAIEPPKPVGFAWGTFAAGAGIGVVVGVAAIIIGALAL